MNIRSLKLCFLMLVLMALGSTVCRAQVTGLYPFGPFDSPGFDTINRGNLNVHFAIPVFSKPGRGGTNFRYSLVYDGLVWIPKGVSGSQAWTPAPNWGWEDSTNAQYGYITYNMALVRCTLPPHGIISFYTTYSGYAYHDSRGESHPIPYYYQSACGAGGGPTGTGTYTLTDNSGLTIYRTDSTFIVFDKQGAQSEVPTYPNFEGHPSNITPGSATYTDTNGNQVSASSSGIFTDTMGMTALTVSGAAPNPEVYTYTDSNNTAQTVTVNYTSYAVQTAFGVSGVSEYSNSSAPLVSSIVYSADNSSYQFGYEPTPGNPSAVTGRLAYITLRTGGTISYAYTGANNGIEADGTTSGLNRTTSDGTTVYTRSSITATQSNTQRTDGAGNVSNFSYLIGNGYFYETDSAAYTGAATGVPAMETQTCYNSSSPPPCTVTSITPPFSNVWETSLLNGNLVGGGSEKTYAGPELLQSDTGATGPNNYTYNSYTGAYGLSFYRLASVQLGVSRQFGPTANYTFAYDETTPAPTSGLPSHISVTTPRGNPTSRHIALKYSSYQLTQTMTYDDAGQMMTQSDWNGNPTTFQYDPGTDSLLTKTISPAVSGGTLAVTSTFDSNTGLLVGLVGPNGGIGTTYTYTGLEQPSSVAYPDGGKLTYTYTTPTNVQLQTLQQGAITKAVTTIADGYGRTASVANKDTTNGDETVTYAYDSAGRLYSVSNPERSTHTSTDGSTILTYDGANRVTKVAEQDNSSVTYTYSASTTYLGTTVTISDEALKTRALTYDSGGRLIQALEPDATGALTLITNYSYDALNDLLSVSQQGGASQSSQYRNRSFAYDSGRLLSSTTPEQGRITYQYDNGAGVLCSGIPTKPCSRTDANGTITTYTYDALNRPTGMTYGGSSIGNSTPSVSYSYDQASYNGLTIANGKAQRTGMSDGSGLTAWSYDLNGRIATIQKTINGTTKSSTYAYNKDGSLQNLLYFSGSNVAYTYNDAGMALTAVDPSGINFATGATYAPPGLLTGLVQGSSGTFQGVQTSNQFNNRLQPSVLAATVLPSTAVFGLTYSYGPPTQDNGNIMGVADSVHSDRAQQTFTYDNLNRLASAQVGSLWGDNYVYDNWGNLLQKNQISGTGPSEGLSATVNTSNQISGYAYDAAGEMSSDNMGNTWTYDAEGRAATVNGVSYIYDGDGNRVEESGGSVSRMYWPGEDGKILNETDLAGNILIRNVYFNGQMISRRDIYANLHHLIRDHLGSERVSVSISGSQEDDIDYFPFGAMTPYSSMSSGNLYTFTGDETDVSESSTMHTPLRQLSGSMGRWTRPDPYNGSYDPKHPQSLNRYAYVLNNPLRLADPTGGGGGSDCQDSEDCFDYSDEGDVSAAMFTLHVEVDLFTSDVTMDPTEETDVSNLTNDSSDDTFGIDPIAWPDTSGPGGQGPGGGTPTPNACQIKVMNAINRQTGGGLTAGDISSDSPTGKEPGGEQNVNFNVTGLTASQFNALQPGRYAPSGVFGVLTGYGSSLHIVAGPSRLDQDALVFSNINSGGMYSDTFTAHLDSAWADNPIGALIHFLMDVLGAKSRKPCP